MNTQLLKNLKTLNQVTLECVNVSNEQEIISKFIKAITKILKADYGFSFFRDFETQKFRLFYKDPRTPFEPQVPRKTGATQRAFDAKKPLYITSYQKLEWARSAARNHMDGVVVIPITYKNKNFGTMDICYHTPHVFTTEEKILCEYVGSSAAETITIFRLNESLRRSKRNLEATVRQRTSQLMQMNERLQREVGERKEAENRLLESQKFTEKIANVVPGLIAVYNAQTGQYIYVNSALRSILGYEKEDFLKKGISFVSSIMHPDDLQKVFQQNQEALQRAKQSKRDDVIATFEYRILHKDGSWKWLNTYGLIFDRAADGSVLHILNISVDVTDRKAMEENLIRQTIELEKSRNNILEDRAKDEALLESIGEGILATDAEGKIIIVNAAAAKILGYESRELLGKSTFDQLLFDESGNEVQTQTQPSYRALVKRQAVYTGNTQTLYYKKKDGAMVPVSITATPVLFKGKTVGIIRVFRDISAEKEVDRAKSELISLASHQLRTPLSAINWYSEALLSGELGKITPEQKKYLQEIFQANQKMVELVYDFLNVSRMELGTFSIKLSDINIRELLASILQEIRPMVKQKQHTIQEHFSGPVETIRADRKIIRLILQNLITNAVKYTPAKGTISVTIKAIRKSGVKTQLFISVKDTGYGIPKDQQHKVFSKLFRADNAVKMDTEGTGLGLYLVKSFIDFCKGTIHFKSQENKGTIFSLTLPVETVPRARKTTKGVGDEKKAKNSHS